MYGVLGSSARRCGTPQRKDGDVVLLLPALPYEGVELLHQELPQRPLLLSVLSDERTKLRKAEHLTLRVMSLYEAVAVEQCCLARIEHYLLLLVAHARHEP